MSDSTFILSESEVLSQDAPTDVIPSDTAETVEYTAPVLVFPLTGKVDEEGNPNFDNTAISGTFRTNDNRADAGIMFITICRPVQLDDLHVAHYYSGYGIAVRPLTAQGVSDAQPNVFVVDNSLARREVVLENILHTGWGDLAYLAATSLQILPNTDYNFDIIFRNDGAMECTIWESSQIRPADPTIEYGVRTPVSDGDWWGIGCSNTGGYQWTIKSLYFSNVDESYAALYCQIDTTNIPDQFIVKAHGYGDRSNTGAREYGIKMYVADQSTSPASWVLVDSHEDGPGGYPGNLLTSEALAKATYADSDGFVHALLISKYTSDYESGIDASIHVDDVWAESWTPDSVHVGGRGDAYVHDSAGPTEVYFDIMNNISKEWILPTNTNITGTVLRPMMLIKNLEWLDISGEPTGVYLQANVDYTFHVHHPDLRFSPREENYFLFAASGNNIRVRYQTFTNLELAQASIDSRSVSPIGYDNLVFAQRIYELFVDVTVTGVITQDEVRTAIYNLVFAAYLETLSLADIEAAIQALDGVTNADVNSMYFVLHDTDGSTDTTVADTMTVERSGLDQFFTISDDTHMIVTLE